MFAHSLTSNGNYLVHVDPNKIVGCHGNVAWALLSDRGIASFLNQQLDNVSTELHCIKLCVEFKKECNPAVSLIFNK